MNCLKKSFIHFLFFSFFMTWPCASLLAEPGQEDFPPLPPDQEKPFLPVPNTPPKDSDSIINYRGNRMYMEDTALEVAQTKCERLDENTIALEIIFNQSINPRSMGHESIYIDGEPLPDGTRFLFNRRGDTIKILIIMNDDEFSMKIQNIQSFNGRLIEPAIFEVELPDEEEAADETESEIPEASEQPLADQVFTDE
ncbi:MAG: hypothetical protein J5726_05910 [Treponema sp.]|nr:hypothetical protein [Treponema sp.]